MTPAAAFHVRRRGRDPVTPERTPLANDGRRRRRNTPMFPTGREFLWVVFNMVRHGLAHRYVQVDADLTDMRMRVQITGPDRPLYRADGPRPPDYLTPTAGHGKLGPFDEAGHDVIIIRLYPDILFADLRAAADAASVATLPPVTWSRRKINASFWDLLMLRTPPRIG